MSSMIYQNLFESAIKKPSGTSTNMLIGKIKIQREKKKKTKKKKKKQLRNLIRKKKILRG